MDFVALTYVLVIFVLIITGLVLLMWPRDRDGKRVPLEEFAEYMERRPKQPLTTRALQRLVMFFAWLAMLGVALTRRTIKHNHHED